MHGQSKNPTLACIIHSISKITIKIKSEKSELSIFAFILIKYAVVVKILASEQMATQKYSQFSHFRCGILHQY
jgi:hypothetical protein